MKYKVPFIKPNFPSVLDIAEDYNKILAANWFTNFGPFEQEFSKKLAAYIGEGYFIAATFSSATAGLMASVIAVLGRGDGTRYVVMPSFTFAAGADALIWCGYRPLFVDIEPSSLQMELSSTELLVNDPKYKDKLAAILFCNAFGVGTSNIEDWEKMAEQANLPLIIDSAAGFGSLYTQNKKLGSAGTCEIFSFHATKPFAIGEGGAVVSRNKDLIDSLISIQNFGFDGARNAFSLGFNGKLQEINAAIGLRQLVHFDSRLKGRRQTYSEYRTKLKSDRFAFQDNAENASLCFATVVVKQPTDRDRYLAKLKAAGVEIKTYYSPALHLQEYFKGTESFSALSNTELINSSVVSLPIHDNMNPIDLALVIDTLNS